MPPIGGSSSARNRAQGKATLAGEQKPIMAQETFVHLATVYSGSKHGRLVDKLRGWHVMEKLDGERLIWDGGITIGMRARDVWFACSRAGGGGDSISTGLWTRLGNVVHVPCGVAWYEELKRSCKGIGLDGELVYSSFSGGDSLSGTLCAVRASVGDRQRLMSVCRAGPGNRSVQDWSGIQPVWFSGLGQGWFHRRGIVVYGTGRKRDWGDGSGAKLLCSGSGTSSGWEGYTRLRALAIDRLGAENVVRSQVVDSVLELESVWSQWAGVDGVEGLIARWGNQSQGSCERGALMLKLKQRNDMEGTVIGITGGSGRLEGMMGSIRVSVEGAIVDVGTGFTDIDRVLVPGPGGLLRLVNEAGERVPVLVSKTRVRIGYKSLTRDGVPTEASFMCVVSE